MKKLSILLLVAVSSTMILFGCGKKEEAATEQETGEAVNAEDIGLATDTAEEETPAAEEETKDGMVKSTLTNEWIDEAIGDDRPIAVMYPINKVALPQYGLDKIDVFYEILEEGKMSRQLGIIKVWKGLEQIGNIRSIRDYFVYCA